MTVSEPMAAGNTELGMEPGPASEPGSASGGSQWGSTLADLVHHVDARVDGWFEPWRGNPSLDGVAKVVTGLGDHGLMWAATTVWRARHTGPERARAVRALTIAGIESSLVNAGLKTRRRAFTAGPQWRPPGRGWHSGA